MCAMKHVCILPVYSIRRSALLNSLNTVRNQLKEKLDKFIKNITTNFSLFFHSGADVNAVDSKGDTALHVAIQENNDNCVYALLNTTPISITNQIETGPIDLNLLNDNGFTPVHLAVKNNNLQIIQLLERKASEMNVLIYDKMETKNGNSPLHLAIGIGSIDMVQHLLKNGKVDVNKRNLSGHTALYLAKAIRDKNNADLIDLLKKNNAQDVPSDEDDTSSVDSMSDIKDSTDDVNVNNISTLLFNSNLNKKNSLSTILVGNEQ